MSGFSAQWLALREPYDMRARNAAVLDVVADAFVRQAAISVVPEIRSRRSPDSISGVVGNR